MVIQRLLRTTNLGLLVNGQRISESNRQNINHTFEDSNNSCLNHKVADTILDVLKQRYTQTSAEPSTPEDAAIKSLELLRLNIQMIFDKEIDIIMQKFVQWFFVPAVKNIKESLGDSAISDDHISKICSSLLENTRVQYSSNPSPPAGTVLRGPSNTRSTATDNTEDKNKKGPKMSLLQQALKRKRPECDYSDIYKKMNLSAPSCMTVSSLYMPNKATNQTAWPKPTPELLPPPPVRNRLITKDSQFILDFRAARVLGITDISERLSSRHPEILRYPVDSQDSSWLFQQKLIPPLYLNSKHQLLLLTEVQKLTELMEYKNNPYGLSTDLQGFKVSEIMFLKIIKYQNEIGNTTSSGFKSSMKVPLEITTPIGCPSKPKSTLSSSHATLSALLASSSSSSNDNFPENYSI